AEREARYERETRGEVHVRRRHSPGNAHPEPPRPVEGPARRVRVAHPQNALRRVAAEPRGDVEARFRGGSRPGALLSLLDGEGLAELAGSCAPGAETQRHQHQGYEEGECRAHGGLSLEVARLPPAGSRTPSPSNDPPVGARGPD